MEAELAPRVLYVTNLDQPGFIGRWDRFWESTALILRRSIWAEKPGGDAISLVSIDNEASDAVLEEIMALEQVMQVKQLQF